MGVEEPLKHQGVLRSPGHAILCGGGRRRMLASAPSIPDHGSFRWLGRPVRYTRPICHNSAGGRWSSAARHGHARAAAPQNDKTLHAVGATTRTTENEEVNLDRSPRTTGTNTGPGFHTSRLWRPSINQTKHTSDAQPASHHTLLQLPLRRGARPHGNAAAAAARADDLVADVVKHEEGRVLAALKCAAGAGRGRAAGPVVRAGDGCGCPPPRHGAPTTPLTACSLPAAAPTHLGSCFALSGSGSVHPPSRSLSVSKSNSRICSRAKQIRHTRVHGAPAAAGMIPGRGGQPQLTSRVSE